MDKLKSNMTYSDGVLKMSTVEVPKMSSKSYSFYVNEPTRNEETGFHENNTIDTTKYNLITFVPKALLLQFSRYANIYFLIIAIVQLIPAVSPLSPVTSMAPLMFVLIVSLIREGIEDYNRNKFDCQNNEEKVMTYVDNAWKEVQSGDLEIGQIILVKQNETFPADLILLDTNLKDGLCYIETATLDGEKSLKNKNSHKNTAGFFNNGGSWKNQFYYYGVVECDFPNSNLYKFDGDFDLITDEKYENKMEFAQKIDLNEKQLLLKGAKLKNTRWAIGFIVYTGHDTKLILNSKRSGVKMSQVEKTLSNYILFIILFQVFLCVVCAVGNLIYNELVLKNITYLPVYSTSPGGDALIAYFTYTLLLNTLIPISLIISLEIVKVCQGYFIEVDADMYSLLRSKYPKAGSISLNEELGQINYVFSDKTGTLTCNKMVFKYCVVGDTCYEYNPDKGNDLKTEEKLKSRARIELNIDDVGSTYFSNLIQTKSNINRDKYSDVRIISRNGNVDFQFKNEASLVSEYFKLLTLCHECIVEENENIENTFEYSGLSPDDIELLRAAKEQGFIFRPTDSQNLRVVGFAGKNLSFEVLNIQEFSSDRKRMSIIVREENVIKLYMKGADNEISNRLSKNNNKSFLDKSKYYVDYFSRLGFRTLFLAMKILDEKTYNEFSKKLKAASTDLANKKERVNEVIHELEQEMFLIGATIVEDKLQDKVADTIRDLRIAKIKVWMLTGDKMNTAYNIGLSCNLITKQMKNFSICGEEGDTPDKLFHEMEEYRKNKPIDELSQYCIIIDSLAISTLMSDSKILDEFCEIASNAISVICCRISPLQKSQVVSAMKKFDKNAITLAIGDGGNDVSMIMEAHIGIGLYGEEGLRAVQASDYAIGEFKFLRKLLFFHGRTNYLRISEMIFYFFFKNFILTIIHFFYGFLNNFSGQTIIDDWFISFYNMLFTAGPLMVKAILEQDLTLKDGVIINLSLPFLYRENRDNPNFNTKSFLQIILRGFMICLVNFIINIYSLGWAISDSSGNNPDLWFLSSSIYTCLILIASIRVLITQNYWTIYNISTILVTSWLFYSIFVIYVDGSISFNSVATMNVTFGSIITFLVIFFTASISYLVDLLTQTYLFHFNNGIAQRLRLLVKERGELNIRDNIPPEINKYLVEFDNYAKKFSSKMVKQIAVPDVKNLSEYDRYGENITDKSKSELLNQSGNHQVTTQKDNTNFNLNLGNKLKQGEGLSHFEKLSLNLNKKE